MTDVHEQARGRASRPPVSSAVRAVFTVGATVGCLALANCTQVPPTIAQKDVSTTAKAVDGDGPIDAAVARKGVYMVGKPYVIAGRRFVPKEYTHYAAEGMASWYGSEFHGHLTANGEIYDRWTISAAHPTMPLPSYARVTNEENGRSIVVRVNDRGPFHARRLIDVSSRAADLLDMKQRGVGRVKVEYIGRAQQNGSDTAMLMATLRTDGTEAPAPVPTTMVADATPAQAPVPVLKSEDAAVPVLRPTRPVFASMGAGPVTTGSIGTSAAAVSGDPALDLGTIGNAATPIAGSAHAGSIPLPPARSEQRSAEVDPTDLPRGRLSVADVVDGASKSDMSPTVATALASVEDQGVGAGFQGAQQ